MSTPLYNGGIRGAIDSERRPYIADDGNWSLQGNPGGPGYRALLLIINGTVHSGYRPSAQREPFQQALSRHGVFTRMKLLEWRGPMLEPGSKVEMILTGGDRYEGWGDNAGEDWMEWGSLDPATLQTVTVSTGQLLVPGETEPPRPNLAEAAQLNLVASQLGQQAIKIWREANPGEAQRYDSGDSNPDHYRSRYGKFMVLLRSAASGA